MQQGKDLQVKMTLPQIRKWQDLRRKVSETKRTPPIKFEGIALISDYGVADCI